MSKNLCICLEYICCIYPTNGYTLLSSSISGRDTSPIPPPRGINSAHGSTSSLASNSNGNTTTVTARSEFYIPTQAIRLQHQTTQLNNHHQKHHNHPHNNLHSANKLPTNTVFNNNLNDFQNHNSSLNFTDIHEQFRQLVMKDILEYQAQREIKAQPLIQL